MSVCLQLCGGQPGRSHRHSVEAVLGERGGNASCVSDASHHPQLSEDPETRGWDSPGW